MYISFIDNEKELKESEIYHQEVSLMQKNLSNLIVTKQKSTMAMALSIVNDKDLTKNVLESKIDEEYFQELIRKYKEYTEYKNRYKI